jgi:hypothetical protein
MPPQTAPLLTTGRLILRYASPEDGAFLKLLLYAWEPETVTRA